MRKIIAAAFLIGGMVAAVAFAMDAPPQLGNNSSTPDSTAKNSPASVNNPVVEKLAPAENNAPAKSASGVPVIFDAPCDVPAVETKSAQPLTNEAATGTAATQITQSLPPATRASDQSAFLYKGECFVAPPEWQPDGIIAADKGKKLLISAGDSVYINIGSDRVRPGMQCMVYRRKGKYKDPETRETVGYEMTRVGKLEITTDVGAKTATAKVILSYDTIELGDEVKIITAENTR